METEQPKEVENIVDSPASLTASLTKSPPSEELADAPEVESESAPTPSATPEPQAPVVAPAPLDPRIQEIEDLKANGLLKALTSERKKRQELQEQLQQYQQNLQSQPYVPEETYDSHAQPNPEVSALKDQMLSMSEAQARAIHPDYDEKFNVFASQCQANPALYESVMSSPHPALAAYEAGKTLLVHQKYGSSLDKIVDGVRKETESAMRKSIRAEIEQEFTGKIAARAKAPTNINAVGGRAATEAEFQTPSFATALKPMRRR